MDRDTEEVLAAGLAERVDDRRGVHPERDQEGEEHLQVAVFGRHRGNDRAESEGQAGQHQDEQREEQRIPGQVRGAVRIREEINDVNDGEEAELDAQPEQVADHAGDWHNQAREIDFAEDACIADEGVGRAGQTTGEILPHAGTGEVKQGTGHSVCRNPGDAAEYDHEHDDGHGRLDDKPGGTQDRLLVLRDDIALDEQAAEVAVAPEFLEVNGQQFVLGLDDDVPFLFLLLQDLLFCHISVRSFMLDQNIPHRAPEVAPVGGEGAGLVGLDVAALGGLHVLERVRGLGLIVEGGQETRLDARMQRLHLGRVEAEIVAAEGPHADQLHLAFQDVDRHRELVQPAPAHQFAPEVDAVVVGELAAVLQALVLQHVGLEVFGVGVHRAELIDTDHIAVPADAAEFDQRAAGRVVVPDRGAELAPDDEEFALVEALVNDFESGPVHPAQQLDAVVGAVLALGDPHVEPARGLPLGAEAVPKIVGAVHELAREAGETPVDQVSLEARGARMAPDVSAVHEGLVGLVEEGIEVADAVQAHAVDDDLRVMSAQVVEGIAVVGVDDEGCVIEFLAVGVEPFEEVVEPEVQRGLEDGVEVAAGGDVVLQFGAGLDALLGVVLGDELLFVAEGDPGAALGEKSHRCRADRMAAQTVSVSSALM